MVTHHVEYLALEDEHVDHLLIECVLGAADDAVDALEALLQILASVVQVCNFECHFDLKLPLLQLDLGVLCGLCYPLPDGPSELSEDLVVAGEGFFDLALLDHFASIFDLVMVRLQAVLLTLADVCRCVLLFHVRKLLFFWRICL